MSKFNWKRFDFIDVLVLIILTIGIILFFSSCSFGKSLIEEDTLYKTKEYIGVFDTCYFHKGGFMRSPSVLIETIHTEDDGKRYNYFICIYGKHCEFIKGELLYMRHEYWNTINSWKQTIVNLDETMKYYLTY